MKVLNINEDHNPDLMAACRTLHGYAVFVKKIRGNRKSMPVAEAVGKAVDDCIHEGILRDFLLKHKAEAVNMSIYEFDEEEYKNYFYEEGREDERVNTEREKARADQQQARADQQQARADQLQARADQLQTRANDAEAEIARLKALLLKHGITE